MEDNVKSIDALQTEVRAAVDRHETVCHVNVIFICNESLLCHAVSLSRQVFFFYNESLIYPNLPTYLVKEIIQAAMHVVLIITHICKMMFDLSYYLFSGEGIC